MDSSKYDYGAHIEKIQEDWFEREEPYSYERTVRFCGGRLLEIRSVGGRLIASWNKITDYEKFNDDDLPF